MLAAIPEPRDDVADTAPKIISFQIPIDKIGEVIGPKGKVINAIQAETGADVNVDDDGTVGTVSIGSTDKQAVEEARRQIELIMDPPEAEVGKTYDGKVVNITKFGAFVNILPGRDGLVHISKLGGNRRIDRVEDVVSLGDPIQVRVDDIDPDGKVSLTPLGEHGGGDDDEAPAPRESRDRGESRDRDRGDRDRGGDRDRDRGESRDRDRDRDNDRRPSRDDDAPGSDNGDDRPVKVSFEDEFEQELQSEFGDLGPAAPAGTGGGGRDRGGRGGGRDRGGRGRDSRR
jgi:polyribonucleotide nucleotidyltransferase